MSEFSIRAIHQLIKSQTDKRVSEPSAEKLREILETYAGDIAELATQRAQRDGRDTVKAKDIRESLK